MRIKAIIFDMDGVLIESMKYHVISWRKALKTVKIFSTNKDLALLEGMSYLETINTLSKKYGISLTSKEKEEVYLTKKRILNEIYKLKVYPYILKLLNFLKNENLKLALVTGANKEFVSKIIEEKFNNFFEVIITGDDTQKSKPNPRPYLLALKKLNLNKDEAIVIENAPLGLESAKKANLKTFALTTTLNKSYLKKADKLFFNHKELFHFFTNKYL